MISNSGKIDEYEKIRREALESSFHTYGYSYIYNIRGKGLNKKLKFLTFLGIIIPALVGIVVCTYGTKFIYLEEILYIAGFFGIAQFILSVWSLNYEWNNAYSFFLEASIEYGKLYDLYSNISKNPPNSLQKLKLDFEKANLLKENIDKLNAKFTLTEKEKRKGMRYSLRKFQRPCSGCGKVPVDMKSSKCGICGNFKFFN